MLTQSDQPSPEDDPEIDPATLAPLCDESEKDYAAVVRVDGGQYLTLRSPERAVRLFSRGPHITARIVWVNP